MSVAFCLIKARQAGCILSVPVLTSRTAGYGSVCPVVSEGRPARGVPIPIFLSNHTDRGLLSILPFHMYDSGLSHSTHHYHSVVIRIVCFLILDKKSD